MQTARAYLFGLGLAKSESGRGRFSREAHEALAKARKAGTKFADDEKPVTTPRVVKAPKPEAIAKPTEKVDIPAVREWAKANGYTIGERGRVHSDIINAYLAGVAPEERVQPEGEFDVYRDSAPRRYPAGTTFLAEYKYKGNDEKTIVSDRTCCTNCKVSLSGHTCNSPSIVLGFGSAEFVPVTPIYPKG